MSTTVNIISYYAYFVYQKCEHLLRNSPAKKNFTGFINPCSIKKEKNFYANLSD